MTAGVPWTADAREDRVESPTGDELVGPGDAPAERQLIWFDDIDGAYLVAAALARYVDAAIGKDVFLVPSERGPAIEIDADLAQLGVVRALVRRLGGHSSSVKRGSAADQLARADASTAE